MREPGRRTGRHRRRWPWRALLLWLVWLVLLAAAILYGVYHPTAVGLPRRSCRGRYHTDRQPGAWQYTTR
jgi:hypothetical protein